MKSRIRQSNFWHILIILGTVAVFAVCSADDSQIEPFSEDYTDEDADTGDTYGIEARKNEFPWLVHLTLGFAKLTRYVWCTGTLVSTSWFLTSAECIKRSPRMIAENITVTFGEHDLGDYLEDGEFSEIVHVKPETVFIHPQFNQSGHLSYNFALVKLPNPIATTYYVRPVKLPTPDLCTPNDAYTSPMFDYDSCRSSMTAGWSIKNNNISANLLKKLALGLQDFDYCQLHWNVSNGLFSTDKLCAGGNDEDTRDRCPGDMGGPLFCTTTVSGHPSARFIIGVYSYGDMPCGKIGGDPPAIYSRVCAVLPWIHYHIYPNLKLPEKSRVISSSSMVANSKGEYSSPVFSDRCNEQLVSGVDYGSCGDHLSRFYYNGAAARCVRFLGCINFKGGNNFDSQETCDYWCTGGATPYPSVGGTMPSTTVPRPFKAIMTLPSAAVTQQSAVDRCAASLVRGVDFGWCGSEPRFYYSLLIGRCISFIGCVSYNPARNNFDTLAACERTCGARIAAPRLTTTTTLETPPLLPDSLPPNPRCTLTPKQGLDYGGCISYATGIRYYWSDFNSRCFSYQGCANNKGNNWDSWSECMNECNSEEIPLYRVYVSQAKIPFKNLHNIDRCSEQLAYGLDFGRCGASYNRHFRYYYSITIGRCIKFLGCINKEGGNNFDTLAACEHQCLGSLQSHDH